MSKWQGEKNAVCLKIRQADFLKTGVFGQALTTDGQYRLKQHNEYDKQAKTEAALAGTTRIVTTDKCGDVYCLPPPLAHDLLTLH